MPAIEIDTRVLNNPKIPLKLSIDLIARGAPEVWKVFYPRIYRDCDRYCSPKIPAAVMTGACDYAMLPNALAQSRPMVAIFTAADKIAQNDTQLLFVAPELLNAAMRTSPPEGLKWMDVKLPYEAAVIMLPKGSVKDQDGNSYDFIGYARHHAGEHLSRRFFKDEQVILSKAAFAVFTTATEGNGFTLSLAITPEMTEFIDVDDEENIQVLEPRTVYEVALKIDESQVLKKLLNLVFRISLALQARPQLLDPGEFQGMHKKHEGLEIWTPNVIGKYYRYQRETSFGGTHASPRLHWRRGHYRHQAYGPRLENKELIPHRLIWIEPVLVGA